MARKKKRVVRKKKRVIWVVLFHHTLSDYVFENKAVAKAWSGPSGKVIKFVEA